MILFSIDGSDDEGGYEGGVCFEQERSLHELEQLELLEVDLSGSVLWMHKVYPIIQGGNNTSVNALPNHVLDPFIAHLYMHSEEVVTLAVIALEDEVVVYQPRNPVEAQRVEGTKSVRASHLSSAQLLKDYDDLSLDIKDYLILDQLPNQTSELCRGGNEEHDKLQYPIGVVPCWEVLVILRLLDCDQLNQSQFLISVCADLQDHLPHIVQVRVIEERTGEGVEETMSFVLYSLSSLGLTSCFGSS